MAELLNAAMSRRLPSREKSLLDKEKPRLKGSTIFSLLEPINCIVSDQAGHFSVEVEIRNFPHCCGRDKIVTDMSHFFWSKDHKHEELLNIRDFRLLVHTIDECCLAYPYCVSPIILSLFQCICAQGGAGKSCLSAYYARLYRKTYDGGVFFISSKTNASIRQSIYKFVR